MLDQAPPSRDSLEGVIYMLEANAEATLALAEAQDTANIIAALAEYGPNLHTKTEDIRIPYQRLTDELKCRLGM